MYNYKGLFALLQQHQLKKSDLIHILHISSRTIAKISRGEKVADSVINKLCCYFNCQAHAIYTKISPNPILQQLIEEKNHKISGGLYHELQIRMTYNSNHIEGSTLTEDQTRRIFETNTLDAQDGTSVDDIIETVNHFRAIDYCIEVVETPLTAEMIKHLHYLLKSRTKDETLTWFNVGDYKQRPNVIGGIQTSSPQQVAKDIDKLLTDYHELTTITFKDIVAFHYQFERIHPFQDGNGRVGRLIAFKECLKNQIIPFIIEERKKHFYYRGLKEWEHNNGFLIDTCLEGQDTFKAMLKLFDL